MSRNQWAATDSCPLLDRIGGKGVYIMSEIQDEADAETYLKLAEPYR